MNEQVSDRFAWLDSHTYRLEAGLANTQWQAEIGRLVAQYPAYAAYQAYEQPFVDQQQYRCSSGLVLDNAPNSAGFLSEQNPLTRAELSKQLAVADRQPVRLLADMLYWPQQNDLPLHAGLLALLDPFHLQEQEWQATCAVLPQLLNSGGRGILEVFHYVKQAQFTDWPPAPPGWCGPVAWIDAAPFHLAVYTTMPVNIEIGELLMSLGWRQK
ncbi:MAG: hypothetical protein OEZ39_07265 [Gammaproteobacteria bacterium]|nr:hypothetical protein [Gammaproteobacteria bacterium]MDH5651657.1 hypothetical protein [Gammaproteobacteria bacterium]